MTTESILCVDDDTAVRGVIAQVLTSVGHRCAEAGDAREARRLLAERAFTVVLCDIGLPGQSGLELLAELAGRRPTLATVMVTGLDDPDLADAALELGAYGYVTKPFDRNELLITVASAARRRRLEEEHRRHRSSLEATVAERTAQLERAYRTIAGSEAELRRAYAETVRRLGRAMEYRDVETGAHVERVGLSAQAIADRLGLEAGVGDQLRLASPLHDIGKIAIGDAILLKPGPLDRHERQQVERHTTIGYELLTGSGNDLLELAATVAWTHHERWDGSGYPRGLRSEQIPLVGRIVAVADVFDALTSERPYRAAVEPREAAAYLEHERGRTFDSAVVGAFLATEARVRTASRQESSTARRRPTA